MGNFGEGYKPEQYDKPLEDGDYVATIKEVMEGFSKSSGNPMLTIKLGIEESGIIFDFYLVKNDYFNANVTRFFDSFDLTYGNFILPTWIGHKGKIHIAKGKPKDNGKSYMEVQYLIPARVFDAPKPFKDDIDF